MRDCVPEMYTIIYPQLYNYINTFETKKEQTKYEK